MTIENEMARDRGEKELTIEKFFGKISRFLSGIDSLVSNNMYISTCVRHQHVVDIDQVDMFDQSVWKDKKEIRSSEDVKHRCSYFCSNNSRRRRRRKNRDSVKIGREKRKRDAQTSNSEG